MIRAGSGLTTFGLPTMSRAVSSPSGIPSTGGPFASNGIGLPRTLQSSLFLPLSGLVSGIRTFPPFSGLASKEKGHGRDSTAHLTPERSHAERLMSSAPVFLASRRRGIFRPCFGLVVSPWFFRVVHVRRCCRMMLFRNRTCTARLLRAALTVWWVLTLASTGAWGDRGFPLGQ